MKHKKIFIILIIITVVVAVPFGVHLKELIERDYHTYTFDDITQNRASQIDHMIFVGFSRTSNDEYDEQFLSGLESNTYKRYYGTKYGNTTTTTYDFYDVVGAFHFFII